MHGAVAASNRCAAFMRRAALPIGHNAARFFNNRNQRLNIDIFQALLDHRINLAQSH